MKMIALAAAGLIAATAVTPTPAEAQRHGWNDGRGWNRGHDRHWRDDRRGWRGDRRGGRGWNRGSWNGGWDRGYRGNRVRCVWVRGWNGPERRCYR
ncbi:hypothetical protein ASE86_07100 [Sphingomonas sp. Leaf33]|uniref:hypothetical protein n=1 Tax=Sphingomonas sp. Leaf33 TaxID=1736215 RepID=UPI0006F2A8B1|nr:hypothetical protein [Sphingomonas sp. Leaf33]KQN25941.1 hypothetical protein ASE86_07100 [Sphingomonas sp. Leaf33]